MRKNILFLFLLGALYSAHAQYWQQQVDYRISVKLDDKTHRLYGEIAFDYLNNSPSSLDSLYIHVWPNAYKNGNSALAEQLEGEGKKLSMMDTAKLGGMSALDFKINGSAVSWSFHPKHEDINYPMVSETCSIRSQRMASNPILKSRRVLF